MSENTIFKSLYNNVLDKLRMNIAVRRNHTIISLEDMIINPVNPSLYEDISQFDDRIEYYGVLEYNFSVRVDDKEASFIITFYLKKNNKFGFISDFNLRIPRNKCDDIYNLRGVCIHFCDYQYYIDTDQIMILISYYKKQYKLVITI